MMLFNCYNYYKFPIYSNKIEETISKSKLAMKTPFFPFQILSSNQEKNSIYDKDYIDTKTINSVFKESVDNEILIKDCLECKIIGSVTFAGISTYIGYLGIITPKQMKFTRIFYGGFALGAAYLSIYRALM